MCGGDLFTCVVTTCGGDLFTCVVTMCGGDLFTCVVTMCGGDLFTCVVTMCGGDLFMTTMHWQNTECYRYDDVLCNTSVNVSNVRMLHYVTDTCWGGGGGGVREGRGIW